MNTHTAPGWDWRWLRRHGGRWLEVDSLVPALGVLCGLGVGALLAMLLWGQVLREVWDLREALAQHADEGAVATPDKAPQLTGPTWDGPTLDERDAAWLWLRQRLQEQGLQVHVLQPEAVQSGTVLASQVARLRLQGAWVDWLALGEQQLLHAPWWTWVSWQVLPTDTPGQVQVDARWRLWLRPERTPPGQVRVWPLWPAGQARAGVPLFVRGQEATTEPVAQAMAPVSSPSWRLWGVRTQAGRSHVVLGQGAQWQVLAPGQRLGPEAYRVDRIGAEGVHLTGRGPSQTVLLPWEDTP